MCWLGSHTFANRRQIWATSGTEQSLPVTILFEDRSPLWPKHSSFRRDTVTRGQIWTGTVVGDVLADVVVPLGLREITVGPLTRTRGPRNWVQVPQPHYFVPTCRGERLAVRAEGDAIHIFGMAFERFSKRLTARHLPQPHRILVTQRGEHLAIRAENYGIHLDALAIERFSERLTAGHIPQPHRVFVTDRGEHLAIWAEGDAIHIFIFAMAFERCANRLPGGHVPQPHRVVVTDRGEHLAIWAEGDAIHIFIFDMAFEWFSDRLVARHVPQQDLSDTRRGERLAIRAENHGFHRDALACERFSDRLVAGHIPQPHRFVRTGRGEHLAIWAEGHTIYIVSVAF